VLADLLSTQHTPHGKKTTRKQNEKNTGGAKESIIHTSLTSKPVYHQLDSVCLH
jgi:hypothetical protein